MSKSEITTFNSGQITLKLR